MVQHPRLTLPSPSPDGSRFAYVVEDPQGAAIVNSVDVATGATTEILRIAEPAHVGNLLLWIPNGRSMLFARVEKNKPSLWVVPAAGGESKPLNLELTQGYSSMRMHPDGRRIAYHTGRNAIELWRLDNFLPSQPPASSRR